MKIQVIDDNPDLAQALSLGFKLEWPECKVVAATNGDDGLTLFESETPDLVLLDIAMPGMDGFEVVRRLREISDVPVIMLTVRGEELDKVRALELGADDYITKPFGSLELMARIKALLRRAEIIHPGPSTPPFVSGDLTINYALRAVAVRGHPVKLTPTEYRLLCALAREPNHVLSHEFLLARVWGSEYRGESDFLKVYVKRLRDKIEEDPAHPRRIVTEWGQGYMLMTH
jgi:two-component system KDP operon response regulator KdpE